MTSLNNMVKCLEGMLETPDLTDWEHGFVESAVLKSQHGKDTSKLSDKMAELVEKIYSKHFAG